jgi:hypothetical protein
MLIYVKCLTYGYQGKDHLISIKSTETLSVFKEKIMNLFNVGENIHIFDDKTERLLTNNSYENDELDISLRPSDDKQISYCFAKDSFYSVSFSEY